MAWQVGGDDVADLGGRAGGSVEADGVPDCGEGAVGILAKPFGAPWVIFDFEEMETGGDDKHGGSAWSKLYWWENN